MVMMICQSHRTIQKKSNYVRDIEQHVEVMQHLCAQNQNKLGVFVSMISNEAEQKIDRIVQQYQVEAEERLARLKFFEMTLSVII